MQQIDIMVENKRQEWEHQVQGMQLQYERKEREALKLKETVELRNKEVISYSGLEINFNFI